MIITGIGSRQTPDYICDMFTEIGELIRINYHYCRSGGADGADYAFEKGARDRCIVYLPWKGFNKQRGPLGKEYPFDKKLREDVLKIIYRHQPYAENLNSPVKRIKSRNVYQVLGTDLQTPSDLVVCWTPEAAITGGTGLAIQIAQENGIEVINFGQYTEKCFNIVKDRLV